MSEPLRIEVLEVVGYATKLTEHMVPTIVAPVFRFRDAPERVVFPPFRIYQGEVHGATIGDRSELEDFARCGEVVLLETPLAAQPCFELWVDDSFTVHYEDQEQVDLSLSGIARQAVEGALDALRRGDLDEADRLASRAMSANERRFEPLAIKAAIRRRQGNDTGVKVMARLADQLCSPESFAAVVERLFQQARERLLAANATEKGSTTFNLACLAALTGDVDECLARLQEAVDAGYPLSRSKVEAVTDFAGVLEHPDLQQFLAGLEGG